jgi:hypothetical protein
MLLEQSVGLIESAKRAVVALTGNWSSAQRVIDAHSRFEDAALRGALFNGGMTLTSISNATFSFTSTTGATATPIVGLYNPPSSLVTLVILQAVLGVTMTNVTATGPGPYVWVKSAGNSAVSTGTLGVNSKTLVTGGGTGLFHAGNALTGLTNALTFLRASSLFGGSAENVSFVATAVAMQTQQQAAVENIDGSITVPPGGVVALMSTATGVAHSAASGILWAEVPTALATQ